MEKCIDIHGFAIDLQQDEIQASVEALGISYNEELQSAVSIALNSGAYRGDDYSSYKIHAKSDIEALFDTSDKAEAFSDLAAELAWVAAEEEGDRAIANGHYVEHEAESCDPGVPLALSVMQKNGRANSIGD